MRDLHGPFVLDVGLPTIKSLDPDDGDIIIEGYAADFEKDRQGERFLPGAFDEAVKKASEGTIPLLLEHNNNQPLGVVEQLRVDDVGLWTRARIATKAVQDAWDGAKGKVEMIRRGVMKGLSVRGHSWGRMTNDGPEIGHIDLAEISVTPVGVQPGALFGVVAKSMQKSMDYAVDPTAAPELAWAAQDWARTVDEHSEEEIRDAVDAYFQGKIKETRAQLKKAKGMLDQHFSGS